MAKRVSKANKKQNGKKTGKVGKGNPPVEHQFSSTNQPVKNGRPKKIYTILKESGYSKDDIRTVFGEMAFYTIKELEEAYKDETKPVIFKVVANAFRKAAKEGNYRYIKEILEQYIGKAASDDKLTIDSNSFTIDFDRKPN